jgi:AraC-like DNA-binding protein
MPRIIQSALAARLRGGAVWRALAADFAELAGLPLTLHGPLGEDWSGCRKCEQVAACRWVQGQAAGVRHCRRVVQTLLEACGEGPAERVCEAGLEEWAVPVRAGGQTIAYLVLGGFRLAPADLPAGNRARHLLERAGLTVPMEDLAAALRATPEVSPARLAALRRWLEMAADRMGRDLLREAGAGPAPPRRAEVLPASVRRVVTWVHGHCGGPLALADAARVAGLSVGHFCRLFHRATGLRFAAYVAHARLRRACDLLTSTRLPVTEIALQAGFQSISQFNRSFRAGLGTTPRAYRQAAAVASAHFAP